MSDITERLRARAPDETAFPVADFYGTGNPATGMTLRDYFAAQALTGLCSKTSEDGPMSIARASYRAADAMMAAREREPSR